MRIGPDGKRPWRPGWALCVMLLAAGPAAAVPAGPGPEWWTVDYRELVDRGEISHSGETVGALLDRLGGRPMPAGSERPADRAAHALLDPLLERYAFVLPDAVDALQAPAERPWVEVGGLYSPGERQPAWAELLRARRYLVESDGAGRLRLFLPAEADVPAGRVPSVGSEVAARRAYARAWPVLRHVFAAERRRLGGDRALSVQVFAYVHEPARTRFRLGARPYATEVADTAPDGLRPPLDLATIERFLASGLQLEGGRLEQDGRLRLLGSETQDPPRLLGRPLTLADFAVAYRAVFHGGAAQPYMSLDRGDRVERMSVNYGGRLRDTALGLVSLLCDVRFKTFSVGLDPLAGTDVRERLRRKVPGFATHVERFARLAGAEAAGGQQTRLWFYPDAVELTLSRAGDLMALARARMTAASERVGGAAGSDVPAWTKALVAHVNEHYDAYARELPELAGLDQTVRLLALFTWLAQLERQGALIPDLDALLAVELPALPTPRSFPQVVAVNALPPAGEEGPVDLFDRAPVVEALARLAPPDGLRLPPRRRFQRALAALDRSRPAQAALAQRMEAAARGTPSEEDLALLARQAERLVLHALAMRSLPGPARERLAERQRGAARPLRVFDVAIGGLDLGLDGPLERAERRSLTWGAAGVTAPVAPGPEEGSLPKPPAEPRPEWRADPPGLPALVLPPHGLGEAPARAALGGSFRRRLAESPSSWVSRVEEKEGRIWLQSVTDPDGPEARARLVQIGPDGRATLFERAEGAASLAYAFTAAEGEGMLRARRVERSPLPAVLRVRPGAFAPAARRTRGAPGLLTVRLEAPADPDAAPSSPVRMEFRQPEGRVFGAAVPRPLLRRLLLGSEVVPAPERGVPGLAPLPEAAGRPEAVMLVEPEARRLPPWAARPVAVPGEEQEERVAAALTRWWARAGGPSAVVGGDAFDSVVRWGRAPRVAGRALLLLPEDGFPGLAAGLAAKLRKVWRAGEVASRLPEDGRVPELVVLVSAEPAGRLGRRLRALARDPRLAGKLLAVWSLVAGPPRAGLGPSLLAEGQLAGVGLAALPAVSLPRVPRLLEQLDAAVRAAAEANRRAETLPGPTLWFY